VEEILRIRLDGAKFWDVREYARAQEVQEGSAWYLTAGARPLSDGQLWRYIAMADKQIAQNARASQKRQIRLHIEQIDNIYAKAMSQGDMRAALASRAEKARLRGWYAPVKIAPTNPQGDAPYTFTIETCDEHGNIIPIPIPPKIAQGTDRLPDERGAV